MVFISIDVFVFIVVCVDFVFFNSKIFLKDIICLLSNDVVCCCFCCIGYVGKFVCFSELIKSCSKYV